MEKRKSTLRLYLTGLIVSLLLVFVYLFFMYPMERAGEVTLWRQLYILLVQPAEFFFMGAVLVELIARLLRAQAGLRAPLCRRLFLAALALLGVYALALAGVLLGLSWRPVTALFQLCATSPVVFALPGLLAALGSFRGLPQPPAPPAEPPSDTPEPPAETPPETPEAPSDTPPETPETTPEAPPEAPAEAPSETPPETPAARPSEEEQPAEPGPEPGE